MSEPVYISLEFTPNPNTLKYSVNRVLLDRGALNLTSVEEARASSPLAARLFEIPGISGVMIGKDFVTVTKANEGDWDRVHEDCSRTLEKYLNSSDPIVSDSARSAAAQKGTGAGGGSLNSEDEKKIIDVINNEIRPAVAMDGGDITFEKFEDGVVYLALQGSCSGCPSSTMTLKMGIETRLKEVVPAVREVVSV